jgi:hypothetical protein
LRHRDGMDLNYGHDDFAGHDRLVRTLSRERAKDMASDYEQLDPAQDDAERRGITFRARVAEITRRLVPERLHAAVDGLAGGLRQPGDAAPGPEVRPGPEREKAGKREVGRQAGEDPENALRRARRQARIRHARASDAILETKRQGAALLDEQRRAPGAARRAFDEVRPHGWQDAEAAYGKDNSSKPKSAPIPQRIRSGAPTASWGAFGNSSRRANASMRRPTIPAINPQG